MIIIKKEWLIIALTVIFIIIVMVGSIPNYYTYPREYLIKNFPTENQPDDITCGPTSVFLILRYYKINSTINEIKKTTKTYWFGSQENEFGMTTPDHIVKALRKKGLIANLKTNELNEIKYEISNNRPVVVLVRSGKNTLHYMVAIGYNEKNLTFSDPSYGSYYSMSIEQFLLAWNYDGNCSNEDYRIDSLFGKTSDYMKYILKTAEVKPKTYIVISEP